MIPRAEELDTMDSSQMHATLGLHVNKLDVKTIGATQPPTY